MQRILIFFTLFVLLFSSLIQASDAVHRAFCSKTQYQRGLVLSSNRLSFKNQGGFINGGVCWWHSRFTRNFQVLAYFSPHKPRPTVGEYELEQISHPNSKNQFFKKVYAKNSLEYILDTIKAGKKVVEIPGFSNLFDFSHYYELEIQNLLERWQLEDGLIRQAWVTGLKGKTKVGPFVLKNIMDDAYRRVKRGEVLYQKLQIRGITAHSWLVIKMRRIRNGYRLLVTDSNLPYAKSYDYHFGDTSFFIPYYGHFVPYNEQGDEWKQALRVKKQFCQQLSSNSTGTK